MGRRDKFTALIDGFFSGSEPKGYNLYDFYGAMLMRIKKNGKYQIRLQYDYKNGNAVNGKAVEFPSFDSAIMAYKLIDEFAVFSDDEKKQKELADLLLNEVAD